MTDTMDLGTTSQLRIRSDRDGLYLLTGKSDAQDYLALLVSEEALRSLWAYLTKILYPRAGDQLTERIETVLRRKEDVPDQAAYIVTAHTDDAPDIITVSGVARAQAWTMHISRETGDDLWTSLEDLLDQV